MGAAAAAADVERTHLGDPPNPLLPTPIAPPGTRAWRVTRSRTAAVC